MAYLMPKYMIASVVISDDERLNALLEDLWEPFAVATAPRAGYDMVYLRKPEWITVLEPEDEAKVGSEPRSGLDDPLFPRLLGDDPE